MLICGWGAIGEVRPREYLVFRPATILIAVILCLWSSLAQALVIKTGQNGMSSTATVNRALRADIMHFTVTVSHESDKEEDAAKLAGQRAAALRSALAERGYKVIGFDITNITARKQPSRIRVQTDQGLRQQIITKIDHTIDIRVSGFEKPEDVIQIAFEKGGEKINRINFGSTRLDSIEKELGLAAIDKAVDKARTWADHVGLKLGEVASVNVRPVTLNPRKRIDITSVEPTQSDQSQVYASAVATVTFKTVSDHGAATSGEPPSAP